MSNIYYVHQMSFSNCVLNAYLGPYSPANIAAVQHTESSLTLTWEQSGIVSDYSVRVTNEEDGDYNVTMNVTQSSAHISGLSVPGGHYNLLLTAISYGKHSSETATTQITSKYIIYNLYLVIMNYQQPIKN
jgi:hypothetical protein